MKRIVLGAVLGLFASSAAAQQNPFKLPKNNTSVAVEYSYTGDMQGTGQRAISHDRVVQHQTTTGKFFGKTSTMNSWTLVTPDSSYSADLTKKTGVAGPNVLPHMAKAYDDLDGASKQRLHQNMQDMVQMISRAFGTQAMWSDEKVATKTYAGEKCDERTFGTFSICSMQSAPAVPLHVSGSLMCVDYEQTATSVKKGDPPASDFAPRSESRSARTPIWPTPTAWPGASSSIWRARSWPTRSPRPRPRWQSSRTPRTRAPPSPSAQSRPGRAGTAATGLRGAQELRLGQGDVQRHQAGLFRGRPRGRCRRRRRRPRRTPSRRSKDSSRSRTFSGDSATM